MTISLSLDIKQFRQDFDAVCERIRHTKQDPNFFDLITALTANFWQHPLFKKHILELDAQSTQNRNAYNLYGLELCEKTWLHLWKHPRAGLHHRKKLACLKRFLFSTTSSDPLPLPARLMKRLQEIAYSLNESLDNPFEHRGLKDQYKQEQMQRYAALDASFCWDRLCFLRHLGDLAAKPTEPKRFYGKWQDIRIQAWEAAIAMSERNLVLAARDSLVLKFALPPKPSLDPILPVEYQIHRADYEGYLRYWQDHIHTFLVKMSAEQKQELNAKKEGKSQRASFAIEITEEFWRENPNAKCDESYTNYLAKCPKSKKGPLSRPQWDRIVKDNKLDPRPRRKKVRGKGK